MSKIKLNEEEKQLINSFNASQNESNKGLIGLKKENNLFNILNENTGKKLSNKDISGEMINNLHQNTQSFLKKSISKSFKEDQQGVEEEEKKIEHQGLNQTKGKGFNSEEDDSNQVQTPKDEEDGNRQLFRKEKIVK